MKTLRISGVDHANASELDAELRAIAGNALVQVLYDNATHVLNIHLDVDSLTGDEERSLRDAVNVHISRLAQIIEAKAVTLRADEADVNARFLASQLARRTPAQIYTLMQGRIDGWTSLAQAKNDLREWLPLLAAEIAVKLQEREE